MVALVLWGVMLLVISEVETEVMAGLFLLFPLCMVVVGAAALVFGLKDLIHAMAKVDVEAQALAVGQLIVAKAQKLLHNPAQLIREGEAVDLVCLAPLVIVLIGVVVL